MLPTVCEDSLSAQKKDVSTRKRNMTLDLDSRSTKLAKVSPDDANSAVLTTPDVALFKLATPDVVKFIIDMQGNSLTTRQPSPGLTFPAQAVKVEPECYSEGFVGDLTDLNDSNSSQGAHDTSTQLLSAALDSQNSLSSCSSDSFIMRSIPRTLPTSSSGVLPVDMEDQEKMKLERKRERNRLAATRCRMRKQTRILQLQEEVEQLKAENAELSQEVNSLRKQVNQLKGEVLEHAQSGCHIKQHPPL